MKISFAMIHAIVNAFKPEGCFHPSKVMQFRTSIKTEFGINLNQLSYDQLRKAIRNNYVCNDTLCIFCGSNFVYAIEQKWKVTALVLRRTFFFLSVRTPQYIDFWTLKIEKNIEYLLYFINTSAESLKGQVARKDSGNDLCESLLLFSSDRVLLKAFLYPMT